MIVPEEILKQACTGECQRYNAGTCPYHHHEKDICPRVRQILMQEQIDEASRDWDLDGILKEHLRTPYSNGR